MSVLLRASPGKVQYHLSSRERREETWRPAGKTTPRKGINGEKIRFLQIMYAGKRMLGHLLRLLFRLYTCLWLQQIQEGLLDHRNSKILPLPWGKHQTPVTGSVFVADWKPHTGGRIHGNGLDT